MSKLLYAIASRYPLWTLLAIVLLSVASALTGGNPPAWVIAVALLLLAVPAAVTIHAVIKTLRP